MSLASIIGLGYSGYATLYGVPILLLPSGTPEDEHLIKSEGAFHPNPASNTGQLPARQRRSLNIAFSTVVSPRVLALLKPLTYGWRISPFAMDNLLEVPFTYIVGTGEGFQGLGHVDEVTLTSEPESLLTMSISLTSWVWQEIGGTSPLARTTVPVMGSPGPLLDHGYKPIAGWNSVVTSNILNLGAIVKSYSLKFTNNWTYQSFLAGYTVPPNPALITAGPLDVSLDLSWLANRQDRPHNSGWFKFYIGGDDPANGDALSIINIDYMVREPRSFDGGGSPNQPILWQTTYFAQGPAPY